MCCVMEGETRALFVFCQTTFSGESEAYLQGSEPEEKQTLLFRGVVTKESVFPGEKLAVFLLLFGVNYDIMIKYDIIMA